MHVSTHQAKEDFRNEDLKIYLNGEIVEKANAVVSVYDSGFMLGDGVWEGLRLHNGTNGPSLMNILIVFLRQLVQSI